MRFVCESCRAQYMINDEKVGPKGVKVRCRKCGYVILVKRGGDQGAAAAGGKNPVASAGADPDDALATQVLQTPLAQNNPPTAQQNAAKNMAADTLADMTSPGAPPAAPGGKPADSFLGDAGDDEIGAVFDQVLNSGAHSIPKESVASEDRKTEAHIAVKGNVGIGEENDDRMSTRVLDAEVVRKLAEETGEKPAATDKDKAWDGKTEKNGAHTEGEVPQTDWFVAIDEKQTGPLTLEKVKEHWDRGEITPDSLCWRAGFTDWVPVSEVAQLAAVLAPRPASKPIVVNAPAGPAVVSVPVESAFSAGGMMKSVRSEVQVPISAKPEETGSWRPSTSLGSLVQDEMAALSRPPPKMTEESDAPELSVKGLLDLPPPEDTNPSAKPINGKNGHAGASVEAPSRNSRPPPPAPPPANPYVATPGATFSSPGITQYRPEKDRSNLPIWIAIGVGAFLVVALLGTVIFLLTRQPPPVVVQQPIVQPPPIAAQPPVVQPPPTTAAPVQPPPTTAAPVQPPPTAVAAKTPEAAPTQPSGPLPPGKTVAALPPGKTGGTTVAKTGNGATGSTTKVAKEPAEKKEAAPPEEKKPVEKKGKAPEKDEFDEAFGGGGDEKKQAAAAAETSKPKSKGYVPPAPGSASNDVKESLGQADVFEVVSSNKPALAKCVEEQRKKEPGVSGKLVMKWTIQTSGKTSNVSVQSEEFKATYMAGCVGGLIKSWTFPKHKVQGDPIVFPFKF